MIDFERLSNLAKDDPKAFEEVRQNMINEFIESVPEEKRQRLWRVQFRIDAKRKLAKNPYQSLVEVSKMMWESVHSLQDALNGDFSESTVLEFSRVKPTIDKK